jgi:nitrite reductase/ring-hydroxylating ferredoxin subunit
MVTSSAGAGKASDRYGMTATMGKRNDGDDPPVADAAGLAEVGSLAQLPAGTTMRLTVGASDLLLVNIDGRVVAIGDLCLRCGSSLSTASLSGCVLTCGGCGWKYDVERGCVDGLPGLRTEMHDVCVDDGRLLVPSAIAAPATVP